jgi:hypothetical protein
MIEVLKGFPDNVLAIAAKGRVTAKDYDEVLIPKIDETIQRYGKVRCFYELGPDYSGFDAGAAWKDFKLGVAHITRWERVAVVTDVGWIRGMMKAFRFLIPGDIRIFGVSEADDARNWIAST